MNTLRLALLVTLAGSGCVASQPSASAVATDQLALKGEEFATGGAGELEAACCNVNADLTNTECTEGFINGLGFSVEDAVSQCGSGAGVIDPPGGGGTGGGAVPSQRNNMFPGDDCIFEAPKVWDTGSSVQISHMINCAVEAVFDNVFEQATSFNARAYVSAEDRDSGEVLWSQEFQRSCTIAPGNDRCKLATARIFLRGMKTGHRVDVHIKLSSTDLSVADNSDPDDDEATVNASRPQVRFLPLLSSCSRQGFSPVLEECAVRIASVGLEAVQPQLFQYSVTTFDSQQRKAYAVYRYKVKMPKLEPGGVVLSKAGYFATELRNLDVMPDCAVIHPTYFASGPIMPMSGNEIYCNLLNGVCGEDDSACWLN